MDDEELSIILNQENHLEILAATRLAPDQEFLIVDAAWERGSCVLNDILDIAGQYPVFLALVQIPTDPPEYVHAVFKYIYNSRHDKASPSGDSITGLLLDSDVARRSSAQAVDGCALEVRDSRQEEVVRPGRAVPPKWRKSRRVQRACPGVLLGELRSTRAVPYLLEELKADLLRNEPCPGIHPAALTLGRIGRPAIEGLTSLLGAAGLVHHHAANALAHAGTEAVPAIVKELDGGNEVGRVDATFALLNLGDQARAAIPGLVARLTDESAWVRGNAATALGNIDEGSTEVVAALRELLQQPDELSRRGALFALELLGRKCPEPLAALEGAWRSADRALAEAAAESLDAARRPR